MPERCTVSEVCRDVPEFIEFTTFFLYLHVHPGHLSDHMVNYGLDTLSYQYFQNLGSDCNLWLLLLDLHIVGQKVTTILLFFLAKDEDD